ncbi:hypothetical protein [Flectobacillus longus]|nr:hypothetical protein [Flectobacillus longus]MDI9878921.1 hypothetical protein [Flectobacillus longus]
MSNNKIASRLAKSEKDHDLEEKGLSFVVKILQIIYYGAHILKDL